jgi:deoxyribodipyrimidine photo-lyase
MTRHARFSGRQGPSYLGVHLRFGTVSIRSWPARLQRKLQGSAGADVWLSELIWRDFYFQILANFPACGARRRSFKPEYDADRWEHGDTPNALLPPGARAAPAIRWWTRPWPRSTRRATCTTACAWWWAVSWCKDLGIDWRWGEPTLRSNSTILTCRPTTAAGSGPAPAAAMHSPISASSTRSARARKFDPQGKFIRRYLPQLAGCPTQAIHAPWKPAPMELAAGRA